MGVNVCQDSQIPNRNWIVNAGDLTAALKLTQEAHVASCR